MEFIGVPDKDNVIGNIELTKIKVTVVMNLEWHNLYYHCHPVGKP